MKRSIEYISSEKCFKSKPRGKTRGKNAGKHVHSAEHQHKRTSRGRRINATTLLCYIKQSRVLIHVTTAKQLLNDFGSLVITQKYLQNKLPHFFAFYINSTQNAPRDR